MKIDLAVIATVLSIAVFTCPDPSLMANWWVWIRVAAFAVCFIVTRRVVSAL